MQKSIFDFLEDKLNTFNIEVLKSKFNIFQQFFNFKINYAKREKQYSKVNQYLIIKSSFFIININSSIILIFPHI